MTPESCLTCGGTGVLDEYHDNGVVEHYDCTSCLGTGRVLSEDEYRDMQQFYED